MKYTQLGKSGLVVSKLSVGCMLFGGEGEYYGLKYSLGYKEADELISRSIDSGINLFDTANMYNAGKSEEMLGKILGTKRKSVLISTKIGFRVGNEPFNAGISYKHIIEQCNQSLKRLNTETIDILQLHLEDPITPIEEIAKALDYLQVSGKALYIGVSNWQAWRTTALAQLQKDRGYSPIVAAQMHYSLLNRGIEDEFLPMASEYGIGILAWGPLSGGFLTGKYTRSNPKPGDARLNTFDLNLFDREKGYTVLEKVLEIAKKHDTSPTAISLAWLLSKKNISSILLGISKLSQWKDNLDSLTVDLSEEELKSMDTISADSPRYPGVFVNFQDAVLKEAKRY